MKKTATILALLLLILAVALPASASSLFTPGVLTIAEETVMIKSGIEGKALKFSAADFKQAMGIKKFKAVTVTALPPEGDGVLTHNGTPVTAGQSLERESLASLTFVPKSGVKESRFTFTCDAYAGGAPIECILRFAETVNQAPVISELSASLSVSTLKNVGVEGVLCATDPEGDALEFIVVDYPDHGSLKLLDETYGDFRYTPSQGYVGSDRFRYVVRDYYGNYTKPCEVKVSVTRADSSLTYADLPNHAATLPAIMLAEENIMLGTLSGDHMYFEPEKEVSRGEFVVMAMKAAGIKPKADLLNTVFEDNEAIPESIRHYIATAQSEGYVIGTFGENGLIFDAEGGISRGEAAMVISRMLDGDLPAGAPVSGTLEDTPVYARDAVSSLLSVGIYQRNEEGKLDARATLSRADAAEMLFAVMTIAE